MPRGLSARLVLRSAVGTRASSAASPSRSRRAPGPTCRRRARVGRQTLRAVGVRAQAERLGLGDGSERPSHVCETTRGFPALWKQEY